MEMQSYSTHRGFVAHAVFRDGSALVSFGNRVGRFYPQQRKLKVLFRLPFRNPALNLPLGRPLRRLLRAEIFHVFPVGENAYTAFFDYRVVHIKDGQIKTVLPLRVRRPLRVGFSPQKRWLYFGEYDTARTPHSSCLFISRNGGESWEKGFCFEPGTVRHIHHVVYDEYRKVFWILTGDYGEEIGIWKSPDLRTVERAWGGRQQFRAVELVPMLQGLLWATDTEVETNRVMYWDLNTNQLEVRQELPGSAFYCRRIGKHFVITTVVEPSGANTEPRATLWVSPDGHQWKEVLRLPRSFLPLRYFGYAELALPWYAASDETPYFYLSTRNCRGGDRMIVFTREQWHALVMGGG